MVPLDRFLFFAGDDELIEALGELSESELSCGLVVDGDRLVGLLSMTDIARALEVGGPRQTKPAS